MIGSYRSSRTCDWNSPRPPCDASQRLTTYGPIQPMDWPERRLTPMERAVSLASALVLVVIGVAVIFHV